MVRRLGAVQAQDYGGARWGVAQRGVGITAAAVDRALADGLIVRTHVLRPTWHLVTPEDIRWMLVLTAPRVRALAAYGNRESGIDDALIARTNRVLAAALHDGHQLTRAELATALRDGGVEPGDPLRVGRLAMAAELDGLLCSGALRGRQHTYALLDEVVAPVAAKDRDEALAELARRYLAGHGPATIKDFAWWSGLSVTDATTGVRSVQASLESTEHAGRTYWFVTPARATAGTSPAAHLLPNFDEYTVGYADRSLLIEAADIVKLGARPDVISNNVVAIDGSVAGAWRRDIGRTVHMRVTMFSPRRRGDTAIAAAAERYASFLERSLELETLYPRA